MRQSVLSQPYVTRQGIHDATASVPEQVKTVLARLSLNLRCVESRIKNAFPQPVPVIRASISPGKNKVIRLGEPQL
jgi:hypothetical protein